MGGIPGDGIANAGAPNAKHHRVHHRIRLSTALDEDDGSHPTVTAG